MVILASLIGGTAVYLFITSLFARIGERQDTLRRRLETIRGSKSAATAADEERNKPFSQRFFKPIISALAKKTDKRRGAASESNPQSSHKETMRKKMLGQAGFAVTAAEYAVIELFVIGGLSVLFALFALIIGGSFRFLLLGAVAGMFIGYTGMRFHLTGTITKRKNRMEQQLPDVLDLLSVSVEAGLGFEQAVNHVISNMEGPLIDELTVTYREMSMGRTRKDALTLLGERCDLEEIKSFAGALSQATQLGISVKNVLRSQAAAMRQARKARVQEKAMKVSVKMLFPMLGFIFPVIFIVLLGPALVNVIQIFAGN